MEVRFEVWSRPETGTFTRQFPLPALTQFSIHRGLFGQGIAVMPNDYARLSEIISVDPLDHLNDVSSIIRAYIGDDHLYDFWSSRLSLIPNETATRTGTLTGGSPGARLEKTKVWPYDYPENPSVEPDWRYGFTQNLLTNGDMSVRPDGLQNPGAEEETTAGWFTTADEITGVGAPSSFEAIEGPGAHTGSWYFQVTGDVFEGARQDFPTIEGKTYTVSVWVSALAGQLYRFSCDGAASVTTGTAFNNSAYVDGTGTNVYVQHTLVFVADDSGSGRIHITSRSTNQTINFDDAKAVGWGLGVEPWRARGDMTIFEGSTDYSNSGTHSLKFRPSSGIIGNDKPSQSFQVVPNSEVFARIFVFHTEAAARLFRMVIVKPGVDPNTSNIASIQKSVSPFTWTEISGGGFSTMATIEIEARWDEASIPVGSLYVDTCVAHQGRDAATAGKFMLDQLTDAGVTHAPTREALTWVVPTFSEGLDSSGAAWIERLDLVGKRGASFRRLLEILLDYRYEARFRANPADETEILFDLYNPGNMGTDYTTGDGGAVTHSGLVSAGPLIVREPGASSARVEGDDNYWAEALNSDLQTAWGDIEAYQGSTELLAGDSLDSLASGIVVGDDTATVLVKFSNPDRVPGIDYDIGDWVILSIGEEWLTAGRYRVTDIVVESGDPEPIFQVTFVPEPSP